MIGRAPHVLDEDLNLTLHEEVVVVGVNVSEHFDEVLGVTWTAAGFANKDPVEVKQLGFDLELFDWLVLVDGLGFDSLENVVVTNVLVLRVQLLRGLGCIGEAVVLPLFRLGALPSLDERVDRVLQELIAHVARGDLRNYLFCVGVPVESFGAVVLVHD